MFVALVIQHAVRMRRMSSVACLALPNFSTLSHKRQDFRKYFLEQEICFDFLYNYRLKHFSFRQELSEMWSQMYIGLHVKYPLFLSDFNET